MPDGTKKTAFLGELRPDITGTTVEDFSGCKVLAD